jgi:hypothetical protein
VLRQVRITRCLLSSRSDWIFPSYDLDLDMRLAEETTVLVETYTVLLSEEIPRLMDSLILHEVARRSRH